MKKITYLCSMIKIRFNLGRGCNFMKWKVENTVTGEIQYIDPAYTTLQMTNATLLNRKAAAEHIHGGANKYPCAWILAEKVEILPRYGKYHNGNLTQIKYNPRENPFWSLAGLNIDGQYYSEIITINKSVFISEGVCEKGYSESNKSFLARTITN